MIVRALGVAALVSLAGCSAQPSPAGGGSDPPGKADGTGSDVATPTLPIVPYNGGPVLAPMTLVSIVSDGDPLAGPLFAYGDTLVASSWWQTIAADYGLGTPAMRRVNALSAN
jgi:hypothetical protein